MESFRDRMIAIAEEKDSRIIFALDVTTQYSRASEIDLFLRLLRLLNGVAGHVAGVKIGLPTILAVGPEAVYRLLNEYEWNVFFIADLKLADIAYVNGLVLRRLRELGFDGAIVHSFIGREKGLEETVSEARDIGIGIVSVVAMSHPGAEDYINKRFEDLVRLSMDVGVDGMVLPATFPKYISMARELGYDSVIMSPGIGPQGAEPGEAIRHGADFEIIGRLIYGSDDPASKAAELHKILRWVR